MNETNMHDYFGDPEIDRLEQIIQKLQEENRSLRLDADRYRKLRYDVLSPDLLRKAGYPNLGDVPEDETIESFIDRTIDESISAAK